MSHKVQWPPAPAQPRDPSQCLARFKVCEELRASPPTTTKAAVVAATAAAAAAAASASATASASLKENALPPSFQFPAYLRASPTSVETIPPDFLSPFETASPPPPPPAKAPSPDFTPSFKPSASSRASPADFSPWATLSPPGRKPDNPFPKPFAAPFPDFTPAFPTSTATKTPSPTITTTNNNNSNSNNSLSAIDESCGNQSCSSHSPNLSSLSGSQTSSSLSGSQNSCSLSTSSSLSCKSLPTSPSSGACCQSSSSSSSSSSSCSSAELHRGGRSPSDLAEAGPGTREGQGTNGTTGRSQSKPSYSRMWEDPLGERHAIPLYNRLHFSTVPRKTVTKKTWYLVHNTYASLQNNGHGHPQHHQLPHHPHHHHHAPHALTNGGRMEEVGADEFCSHNHAERLMRKMETCANKRQLCDVVLIVGNKRLPAHRLVLSAASDYFAAMFMNNVREANMEEVELKDVDPEALASLVQYMYTGRIELKEETVECLLSTACLLQLSEVVEACCSFLMKQLHPSNCIGIRQFADAQGCTDLYKVANNYVMEMFVEVMHNAEFLMLPCDEVCKLLASDDLNVPNEETIFEALVKWAKHDLTVRRKYLPRLLSHIKLPLMAPQYIADHVETNCLFREERECQQLIMEALKYHLLPERRSSFQSPRTKPRKSTVGVLYAVGGMDCTKGATSIEKYELRTNTWTQVANMSGRRLQFGVAVLEDRLYVVGGRDGLKTLNTVECYDPKKKTWTLMPPMSTHRHGLGVGVLEGPMYAVGGHDGWSYLNTVERWDPQARQWSYVAPMSTARSTVGVASLHGKLYAVGGRDGSSCLKSVECFDPHTNKWTHCTPMATRRGGVGVATCNGFLYAVGGHEAPATNPTCSRYDSAERYDPKTDQWTNISPISSPRDAVGLCPLGDKLFAVGGYDGQQYLNDVECYDPISNEWVKVSSLCTGRAGACVVHVPNS